MDTITTHQRAGNEANKRTYIEAAPDGLYDYCHAYIVRQAGSGEAIGAIDFQLGNPAEVGINGITAEILLTVLVDHLDRFQKGPHACRENALVITKLQEAQHWLAHRTANRIERGVEGTDTP